MDVSKAPLTQRYDRNHSYLSLANLTEVCFKCHSALKRQFSTPQQSATHVLHTLSHGDSQHMSLIGAV